MSKVSKLENIDEKVSEYHSLRAKKKVIEDRIKILSAEIKSYAENNGAKNDSGSFYCDNGAYMFGSQAKKSVSFVLESAISFLKSKGLTDAIKLTEGLDESVIEGYVTDGTITFEDLESITNTRTIYALDVKKKEEMPVVEQSSVQLAASRKPKKPILRGGKK